MVSRRVLGPWPGKAQSLPPSSVKQPCSHSRESVPHADYPGGEWSRILGVKGRMLWMLQAMILFRLLHQGELQNEEHPRKGGGRGHEAGGAVLTPGEPSAQRNSAVVGCSRLDSWERKLSQYILC